eukprot:18060-Prorocentrum_minimum.AAC.1
MTNIALNTPERRWRAAPAWRGAGRPAGPPPLCPLCSPPAAAGGSATRSLPRSAAHEAVPPSPAPRRRSVRGLEGV